MERSLTDKVVRKYLASVRTIDRAWVEKLRKDFLVLMKNLPRAKDYNTALELKEVSQRYQRTFYQWVFEEFLNPQKEADRLTFESVRKPAWDFYIEFPLPIERANDYHSEEQCFYTFEREKPAWEKRIRRKAQILWKTFNTALTYTEKGEVELEVPDVDRTVLEGFQTKIIGYNPREKDWEAGALERMKESLRRYRRQASKTLPWLLQHQLPLVLNFKVELDKGATYEKDHIEVTMSSMIGEKVEWGVHMLAHEMGHHMFKGLSKGARVFWDTAIRQDYGPIDLRELLSKWPPSMKWTHSFYEQMAEKEPVLALQVDVLSRDKGGNLGWEDRDRFQRALDSGEATVQVPKHPITGYAGKNPEEAFCEAVGLIVAYGPRAVPDQVRDWMETIIPGKVRLASQVLERYARRLS